MVFEVDGEGCSLVPWGPVALWGSTETLVGSPEEGRAVAPADVDWLLTRLNRHLRREVTRQEVTSLRCGVRGLAVARGSAPRDPLRLSKRWRAHADESRPWITLYGGKITSCFDAARHIAGRLAGRIRTGEAPARIDPASPAPLEAFPGIAQPVPAAGWCRRWLACRTLEDYLRRRTNIAQWTPRGGLGRAGEHRGELLRIAAQLCEDPLLALRDYERAVEQQHDAALPVPPPPPWLNLP